MGIQSPNTRSGVDGTISAALDLIFHLSTSAKPCFLPKTFNFKVVPFQSPSRTPKISYGNPNSQYQVRRRLYTPYIYIFYFSDFRMLTLEFPSNPGLVSCHLKLYLTIEEVFFCHPWKNPARKNNIWIAKAWILHRDNRIESNTL